MQVYKTMYRILYNDYLYTRLLYIITNIYMIYIIYCLITDFSNSKHQIKIMIILIIINAIIIASDFILSLHQNKKLYMIAKQYTNYPHTPSIYLTTNIISKTGLIKDQEKYKEIIQKVNINWGKFGKINSIILKTTSKSRINIDDIEELIKIITKNSKNTLIINLENKDPETIQLIKTERNSQEEKENHIKIKIIKILNSTTHNFGLNKFNIKKIEYNNNIIEKITVELDDVESILKRSWTKKEIKQSFERSFKNIENKTWQVKQKEHNTIIIEQGENTGNIEKTIKNIFTKTLLKINENKDYIDKYKIDIKNIKNIKIDENKNLTGYTIEFEKWHEIAKNKNDFKKLLQTIMIKTKKIHQNNKQENNNNKKWRIKNNLTKTNTITMVEESTN